MPPELRAHIEAEHVRLISMLPENWTAEELQLYRAITAITERQQWVDLAFREELRDALSDLAAGIHQLKLDMDIVVPRTGLTGVWAAPRARDDA